VTYLGAIVIRAVGCREVNVRSQVSNDVKLAATNGTKDETRTTSVWAGRWLKYDMIDHTVAIARK
jgi:hypothetical protein